MHCNGQINNQHGSKHKYFQATFKGGHCSLTENILAIFPVFYQVLSVVAAMLHRMGQFGPLKATGLHTKCIFATIADRNSRTFVKVNIFSNEQRPELSKDSNKDAG